MKLDIYHLSKIIRLYPNGVIELKEPVIDGKQKYSFIQVIYNNANSFRFRKNDYVCVSCEHDGKCCRINYYYGQPNNTIHKITKKHHDDIKTKGLHTFKKNEPMFSVFACCAIKQYIPSNGHLH